MDAFVEEEALNDDSDWKQIFSPTAFERINPLTVREKMILGISTAFGLACFVVPLIVCAQASSAQEVTRRCDPGWSEHGAHCYKLLANRSFYEANHVCRHDYGGELASVHSKNQSDFLVGLATKFQHDVHIGAWIGLQREKGTNSQWAWTDDTPLDFENWSTDADEDKPDKVDTSEHSCVLVVHGFYEDRTQWVIRSCGRDGQTAICQKEW